MIYISKNKKYRLKSVGNRSDGLWILENKNSKQGFFHDEYLQLSILNDNEKSDAIYDLNLIPIWKLEP